MLISVLSLKGQSSTQGSPLILPLCYAGIYLIARPFVILIGLFHLRNSALASVSLLPQEITEHMVYARPDDPLQFIVTEVEGMIKDRDRRMMEMLQKQN